MSAPAQCGMDTRCVSSRDLRALPDKCGEENRVFSDLLSSGNGDDIENIDLGGVPDQYRSSIVFLICIDWSMLVPREDWMIQIFR